MSEAKKGDKVKVHYTGKLNDGSVFDSSVEREPLEFELGAGMMIAGFDKAVHGMKIGDKKTAEIPSKEAYGERNDDMIVSVPKAQLPPDLSPSVGQQLSMQQPSGQAIPVVVTSIDEENIEIDANHPLAGKDLTFEIELVEIV
ncbi:FKBP-type peptidyl-prolyl cis-trans isomerase [Fulvivirga lutea]|uniref:Peptidyl-prolyl cis-trans isomerase n=1 Tax=Fulvivirga lutea TaxID=2810512 RepID=A0A974WFB7_9BACT|nr:peptidylprolyl isomerase [Fulvivirga lutea]QSE96930.1 peptidylprolyl isomerase [Fulvivirga lutea]